MLMYYCIQYIHICHTDGGAPPLVFLPLHVLHHHAHAYPAIPAHLALLLRQLRGGRHHGVQSEVLANFAVFETFM
jgi:hypothetical protein